MTPEENEEFARRRKANIRLMGMLLGALAILIFFVTVAKMGMLK